MHTRHIKVHRQQLRRAELEASIKDTKCAFESLQRTSEVLQPSPSANMSLHSGFTISMNYSEAADAAAVLGMINLCKLCKQFACIPKRDEGLHS